MMSRDHVTTTQEPDERVQYPNTADNPGRVRHSLPARSELYSAPAYGGYMSPHRNYSRRDLVVID